MPPTRPTLHRFDIRLRELRPPIWRILEVPSRASFWELHVAIQDAMGWLDYHHHSFTLKPRGGGRPLQIGIPDEFDADVLPGWEEPIARWFTTPGDSAMYAYDFGDDWLHDLELIAIEPRARGVRYPRCTDGARACPPEDCGGVPGYLELLEVLANPAHPERDDMIAWLKGHAKNYYPYEPEAFEPAAVKFSSAARRLAALREGR
jgi:hypothetical protein